MEKILIASANTAFDLERTIEAKLKPFENKYKIIDIKYQVSTIEKKIDTTFSAMIWIRER